MKQLLRNTFLFSFFLVTMLLVASASPPIYAQVNQSKSFVSESTQTPSLAFIPSIALLTFEAERTVSDPSDFTHFGLFEDVGLTKQISYQADLVPSKADRKQALTIQALKSSEATVYKPDLQRGLDSNYMLSEQAGAKAESDYKSPLSTTDLTNTYFNQNKFTLMTQDKYYVTQMNIDDSQLKRGSEIPYSPTIVAGSFTLQQAKKWIGENAGKYSLLKITNSDGKPDKKKAPPKK